MSQYLPANLLALFAPRDPVEYLVPAKLPHEKNMPPYGGMALFVNRFEDPKDTPLPVRAESRDEKQERKNREKAELVTYRLEQDLALWDPHNSGKSSLDPYKTLFVARINFDTSESKLRREFETYGSIKQISMSKNVNNGKPRGYAFIEYESERDMRSAYKHADGRKIDGRRVLVDVERGRTVEGWRPRRLGGGLGQSRVNPKERNRDENMDTSTSRPPMGGGENARGGEDRWGGGGGGGGGRGGGRSPERSRRRRSRSRERGGAAAPREGGERRRRSRSRERRRSRDRGAPAAESGGRRRSRSRERRRSRSGDRKRARRTSRDRGRREAGGGGGFGPPPPELLEIKQEPNEDHPAGAERTNGDQNASSEAYNNY